MTASSAHPEPSRGRDRGFVGVTVVLAVAIAVALAAVAGVAVVDLAVTAQRARAAADAAVLAAAGTSPLVAPGRQADPAAVAGTVAKANGARLVRVELRGAPLHYAAEVEMEAATGWVQEVIGPLSARAAAGVRPRRSRDVAGHRS